MTRHPKITTSVLVLVVTVISLFGSGPVSSQDCPELVGRVPYGPARTVASAGDYVYYSSGSVLMIADVSNPVAPMAVGELQLPDLIQGIEVADEIAHVVCGDHGYWMVDVGLPSAPSIVGSYPTGGFAGGVAVSGDLVFVADGMPGLTILDVSQPSSIELVSQLYVVNSYAVEVLGPHAYLVGWDGLRIVDVSDPSLPVILGSDPQPGLQLVVSGDYAYVAAYPVGLRVYDVSSPGAPVEVNMITMGVADVEVANNLLYVTDGYRLVVFDLSDPASPSQIGEAPAAAGRVAVNGNHAHVACGNQGLRVFDVNDPTAPVEVAVLDTPGQTLSVAASGPLVFADGGGDQVRVFDTTNPASPVKIAVAESDGPIWDLAVVEDWVYVANGGSFRKIDVSDPHAPVDLGGISNGAIGIEISGDFAYLASFSGKLVIMDISDPAYPTTQGSVALPVNARKVAVSGSHAYVTVVGHGIQVVDVSDPNNPTVVGEFGAGEYYYDVDASGNHIFVADTDGLHILDVTVPATPIEVGHYYGGSSVISVAVNGSHAYLGEDELRVIDVSDPTNPHSIGVLSAMEAAGYAERIKVDGDLVYLAHYIGGVSIVRGCHAIFVDGFESGDTTAWTTADATDNTEDSP